MQATAAEFANGKSQITRRGNGYRRQEEKKRQIPEAARATAFSEDWDLAIAMAHPRAPA